jgi:ABC-2 type transport system ATP-binding protein
MDPIISIRHLNKNYGTKKVLSDISIDISPGQIIGYIGPNGAGKSTTVKILCGLISDFTGEVIISDIDVRKNPVEVKRLIGYIPEMAELYDVLTPMEFLRFIGSLYSLPAGETAERAENMLEAFGMAGNKDKRMDTFSKGMKQKVLIISGLLHNPEILILDEPLNGLDANSVIIVKDLLDKMASKGKTIFYCSHMMDIVEKVSDRIILINEGKVIADGTFEELKLKEGDITLEKIFAHLTADESLTGASDKLISAFENKTGN